MLGPPLPAPGSRVDAANARDRFHDLLERAAQREKELYMAHNLLGVEKVRNPNGRGRDNWPRWKPDNTAIVYDRPGLFTSALNYRRGSH